MTNQIEEILPRSEWEKVTINENAEPLIEIKETRKLKLGNGFKNGYQPSFLVRKTVAKKLIELSEKLPDYINIVLIEGFRSLDHQEHEWWDCFMKLKEWHHDHSDEIIANMTDRFVARPGPKANHFSGGAVDVTLAYGNGELLDMGTPYISQINDKSLISKVPMLSGSITPQQDSNRFILRKMMASVGFVWYPGEWWHYCFGDRMWAVYTGKTKCLYGPTQNFN
jgi:D-alanyl-D-alanine dipeptidase